MKKLSEILQIGKTFHNLWRDPCISIGGSWYMCTALRLAWEKERLTLGEYLAAKNYINSFLGDYPSISSKYGVRPNNPNIRSYWEAKIAKLREKGK